MVMHSNPRKAWTKLDFLILEAYEIFKGELCPQCGYPRWICHNEDNNIVVSVNEDVCAVKGAIESKERSLRSRDKDYEPTAGAQWRPEVYAMDGTDLRRYRRPYYESEWQKAQEVAESRLHVS